MSITPGTKLRHLSLEERIQIAEFIKQGMSYIKMGTAMKRSDRTIAIEVKVNGNREAYDPHKAHERSQRMRRISSQNNGKLRRQSTHKRINDLEEQLDIILQTVTRLLEEKQNG